MMSPYMDFSPLLIREVVSFVDYSHFQLLVSLNGKVIRSLCLQISNYASQNLFRRINLSITF